MRPEKHDFQQMMIAGAVATLVLIVLMYLAPYAGLPRTDMAARIGAGPGATAQTLSAAWWIGLLLFFLLGSVLSPVLFLFAVPALFGRPWVRGIEWGALVWAFGGAIAMVYLGLGYEQPQPHMSALISFVGHLLYGAILGALAAPVIVRMRSHQEKTA